MGVMGWELAAIIQTPSLVQSSFTKYTLKMLMIYQRKIDARFEKVKALRAASTLPNTKGFGKAHFLGGRVFGSTGGTPADQFHQHNNYSNTVTGNTYRTDPPLMANGGHAIGNGHATIVRDQPPSYWATMNGSLLSS